MTRSGLRMTSKDSRRRLPRVAASSRGAARLEEMT
jgi:hypothetical protein